MMRKILKSRLSGRSGFTLSETLMAILILLMVSSIVAAGIPVAANAYSKVVMASNAQLLLSTTMTNLRDELGTATDIHYNAETGEISYKNDRGGRSRIYMITAVDPDDGITKDDFGVHVEERAGRDDTEEYSSYDYMLVSDVAATENLFLTYTVESNSGGFIKFSDLTVQTKDDDRKVISKIENFEIKVLTVK